MTSTVCNVSPTPSASVSVSEDYSRKARLARSQLRTFGRKVRRDNPEKKIKLLEDKLVVDGKMFVYSEETGEVREHRREGGGHQMSGKYKWVSLDSLESL